METPECDAAATFQGRAEERDDDLEHLPPLLEDEVGRRFHQDEEQNLDFTADVYCVFTLKKGKNPNSLLICPVMRHLRDC